MSTSNSTASPAPAPPLRLSTQMLYAFGASASATKQAAIGGFLLIFYNQVIGMEPATVALVISITLIFDAFFDPLVGQISDNFRHRWGRRHPFMYFAVIPVPIAFFLLWNPPTNWPEPAMLAFLLLVLLAIRLFDTFFELPSAALLPELTEDYNKRTLLFTFRSLFTSLSRILLSLAAYQVFMRENPDGSGGILAREGYLAFSITFAIYIGGVMLISAIGTHSRVPYLHQVKTKPFSIKEMAGEMLATLNNRAFVSVAGAGIFMNVAFGVFGGLSLYFSLYFWELSQSQIAAIVVANSVGSICGVPFAPFLARRIGKKRLWLSGSGAMMLVCIAPISLRLMGLMPSNGTTSLFAILLSAEFFLMVFAGIGGVMTSSMVADVVEDAQVKTGRRSEGLLMAADNLFKKLVSSSGVLIAGVILSALNFPKKAERGGVDPEILFNMGLIWVPTYLAMMICAFALLCAFPITEARHNDNLRRLRETQPAE